MLIAKIGNDALYLLLKTNEKSSSLKKKRKKNKGNTIVESILKLSWKSFITLSFACVLADISIIKKLPVMLIKKPNKGISNEPLKKIAKSVAVRRYSKKALSIHRAITPTTSLIPKYPQ